MLFRHFSQLHCCRNTLLRVQATHFTSSADTIFKTAFPLACMSSFKERLSFYVHPLTCPAACDHPWKHSLSMIPSFSTGPPPLGSCYPPTIPWGGLGSDQQCLCKWLLHSSTPLAPVYGPAGKQHHSRSCFSDRTVQENIKPDRNADTSAPLPTYRDVNTQWESF